MFAYYVKGSAFCNCIVSYQIENCFEILEHFFGVFAHCVSQGKLEDGGETSQAVPQERQLFL